jgi:hypothetical protein
LSLGKEKLMTVYVWALHAPAISSWDDGTFDFDDDRIRADVLAQLEDPEPTLLIPDAPTEQLDSDNASHAAHMLNHAYRAIYGDPVYLIVED